MSAIPSAHAKLRRLNAESAARGGKLVNFAAVAKALDISPGRLTQLFGISNPSAENAIKSETLGLLATAFSEDGVPLTIAALLLPFDDFAATLTAPTRPQSKSTPAPEEDSDAPSADWLPGRPDDHTEQANLAAHPPRPLNSRPGCYYLNTSLRFEPQEHRLDSRTLLVGLSSATLEFASNAYQIAANSLLGDAARPHDGVTVGKTSITVSVPDGEMLRGNPLGEYYMAIIEPREADDPNALPAIALHLHTAPRHFTFRVLDDDATADPPQPGPTKAALMKLVFLSEENIARHRNDASGRIRLARASVTRKPSDAR